jgi:hypothetical protein
LSTVRRYASRVFLADSMSAQALLGRTSVQGITVYLQSDRLPCVQTCAVLCCHGTTYLSHIPHSRHDISLTPSTGNSRNYDATLVIQCTMFNGGYDDCHARPRGRTTSRQCRRIRCYTHNQHSTSAFDTSTVVAYSRSPSSHPSTTIE